MLVSLIAAIVAALLYGIAAVMQAIAVRAASNKSAEDASGGVDPGLVVRACCTSGGSSSAWSSTCWLRRPASPCGASPCSPSRRSIAANLAVTAVVAAWVIAGAVLAGVAGGGGRGRRRGPARIVGRCRQVATGVSAGVQAGAHPGRGGHRACSGWPRPGCASPPAPRARRDRRPGLWRAGRRGPGAARLLRTSWSAIPPPYALRGRGHRLVHAVRHRAGGRQRDRGHRRRRAGRDDPAAWSA